jgi:hypothetical protein
MKNEKPKLRTSCDYKTPSAKKRVLVNNCWSICLCPFFPPQALINTSAGRSFHFDFLIFNFSFLI